MFYVKPSASVSCSFRFFYFHSLQAICNNYIRESVCGFHGLFVFEARAGLGLLTEAAELSRLVGATKFSLDIVQ